MSVLLTVLGSVLVLGIMFEVLWTAGAEGAGPLTKRLGHYQWQFLLGAHRRFGGNWVLVAGGVGVFVCTLMFWVATLWTGWSLIFWGTDAVVAASTGAAADGTDVVYFVGYTLFTLGTGDFVPHGGVWQVLTPVASLSGLFVVTFSISYLVSIIQAIAS